MATVDKPAPARNAAMPAIAAAPALPVDPPSTSTWPKLPLFATRGPGADQRRHFARSNQIELLRGNDGFIRRTDWTRLLSARR